MMKISSRFSTFSLLCALLLILTIGCSTKSSNPASPEPGDNVQVPLRENQSPAEINEILNLPDSVRLVVILAGTPEDLYTGARESADSAFPQIGQLSEQIKDIYRNNRENLATASVGNQVKPLVDQILSLKRDRAAFVSAILHGALDGIQKDAIQKIEAISDTVVVQSDVIINSLTVITRQEHIAEIRELPVVLDAVEDTFLIPLTDTTVQSVQLKGGAYPLGVWDEGFHGEGISVMAMDTGVYVAHDAFNGLSIMSEKFPVYAGTCSTEDSGNHGTQSAGVIASQDETYRGMAYGIDTYYNAKMCEGYDGFAQIQAAYDWSALGGTGFNKAAVINFSMVFAFDCEDRTGLDMVSEFVDNTIDLYDVVWSLGAGNRSAGCPDDQINDKPAVGYNGVAVAAVIDNDTGLRDDDAYYADSKYGPCTGPFGSEERLKPDIMAPTGATAPSSSGTFTNFSGTSGSAPHYSGVAAVLMSAGVTNSVEIRALTFATAEDYVDSPASEGPDFYAGFGYVNAWNAYAHIGDTYSGSFSDTGDSATFRISDVHAGDRVVLVWNKHKSGALWKISDLNLRVYDKGSGSILYETTRQYENKEYIQFGASDEGKDVIIAVVGADIADGISSENWSVAANAVMTEYESSDIKAPVLISPPQGYDYILSDNILFNWSAAGGTNPASYWVDIWHDGEHFQPLPEGGVNVGLSTQIFIPFHFVETRAGDGVWEWAVASEIGGQKFWSEKSPIHKYTAPTLYSPIHNAEIYAMENFDWNDSPGALNYVAKVTGILPADAPFYLPLNNAASQFVLSQNLYDFLDSDKTYTWAIAGTALGMKLTAGDQETLGKLSYSTSWSFEKVD